MNFIDLLIIAFCLFYAAEGLRRGLLGKSLELLTFLGSFLLAFTLYGEVGNFITTQFTLSQNTANAIGFLVIATVSEIILGFLGSFLLKLIPEKILLSPVNHLLGFLPAAIDALIITAIILTSALVLPISGSIKGAILQSRLGSSLVEQTAGLEAGLKNVFGGAIEDSLAFITVPTQSGENVDLKFKTTEVSIDTASEEEMLSLVNQERAKEGLIPLVIDPRLTEVARKHSTDMFARGFFSHVNPDQENPFDRLAKDGITYIAAGENLAYAPSVRLAHLGLMRSPGHKANILGGSFGKVGLGVMDGGVYGKMFTQVFTN